MSVKLAWMLFPISKFQKLEKVSESGYTGKPFAIKISISCPRSLLFKIGCLCTEFDREKRQSAFEM